MFSNMQLIFSFLVSDFFTIVNLVRLCTKSYILPTGRNKERCSHIECTFIYQKACNELNIRVKILPAKIVVIVLMKKVSCHKKFVLMHLTFFGETAIELKTLGR